MREVKVNNGVNMLTPEEIAKNQKRAALTLQKLEEERKNALTKKEQELKDFIDAHSVSIEDEEKKKHLLCKVTKEEWGNLKKNSYLTENLSKIYKNGLILTDCKSFKLVNYDHIPSFFLGTVVKGDFDCLGCKITSLKNAPTKICGDAKLSGVGLRTLEGSLEEVNGNCYLACNKLHNLYGLPFIYGNLVVACNNLKDLNGVGFVAGDIKCEGNSINTFIGLEKSIIGGKLIMKDDLSRFQGKER